jgi:hypothetical protein
MAFTYRLVLEDGSPADPPKFTTAVPTWHRGHVIPGGGGRKRGAV